MAERWLVVSHEAGNSGAPRMLLDLLRGVRAVRGASWECEMIFNQGGPLLEEFAKIGTVHRLSKPWTDGAGLSARAHRWLSRRLWFKQRAFSHLVADWQTRGEGVIFSNTATNGWLLTAMPRQGVRVISYVHESKYGLSRFNRPIDLAATLARTNLFLAVSSAVSSDLHALGVDRERIRLMPNFLPELPTNADVAKWRDEGRRRLNVSAEMRLIVGCGHIERVKGPDLFVEMARRMKSAVDGPFAFVWLGRAADQQFAREVHSVSDRTVRFVGEVSDPNSYFAASDLVVVASRSESFSRVALEAGALGRPVLAFEAARGPADILPRECLVSELSGGAMAAAAAVLLKDSKRAERIGNELRERIAAGFLAEQWIGRLIALVEDHDHG